MREFLLLQDENIVDKLNKILYSERKRKFPGELEELSLNEFNEMIDKAEADSQAGKLKSAGKLREEVDSWD